MMLATGLLIFTLSTCITVHGQNVVRQPQPQPQPAQVVSVQERMLIVILMNESFFDILV